MGAPWETGITLPQFLQKFLFFGLSAPQCAQTAMELANHVRRDWIIHCQHFPCPWGMLDKFRQSGKQSKDDRQKDCSGCKMPLLRCDACGQQLAADDRFCGECGAPVAQAKATRVEPDQIEETDHLRPAELVPVKKPVPLNLIIGALAAAGVAGYVLIPSGNDQAMPPSPAPSVQQAGPKVKSLPIVNISRPGNGAQRCTGTGASNCVDARGEFSYRETLVSDGESSKFDIELGNGKLLAQRVTGRVARTQPPPQSVDTVSMILLDGWMQGYVKDATVMLVLGDGLCEISEGSYDASYYRESGMSRFVVSSGGARCEDANGDLHFLSWEKSMVRWKN